MIIEVYDNHNKVSSIKDPNSDFLILNRVTEKTLTEPAGNLNHNTKKALSPIKELSDKTARARRFVANESDVDKIIPGLRDIANELLLVAGLK